MDWMVQQGYNIPVSLGGGMDFGNILWPGARLTPGDSLTSVQGHHRLVFQPGGSLDIISDGQTVKSLAPGKEFSADHLIMQGDGNLVLYDSTQHALFDTHTFGNAGSILVMQDDGNLVIYKLPAIWASNTEQ